jgi:Na+/melibiose symporter-like transporter
MQNTIRTPKYIFILFALGQLGWSLTCFSVCNCVNYFYVPPIKNGIPEFPNYISHASIFGLFTILGAIVLSSFLPDALTSFLVANKSDKDTSSFGRRKKYMAIGILPFALFSVLVFSPITTSVSHLNAIWFAFSLFAFYISWAFYLTPYNAMINDLGNDSQDRLTINMYISITWALGFLIGNSVYVVKGYFQSFMSTSHAFQYAIALFSFIGFLLMLVPIIFIDEKKYCTYHSNELANKQNLFQSIKEAFKESNFRSFVVSDAIYWLASNTISVCLVYYVVNLLNIDEQYTSLIGLVMLLGSFAMYIPVNFLSKKMGKKKLQQTAYILLTIAFGMIFFLGKLPISNVVQLLLLGIVIMLPLASFGILPNAILGDLIEDKKNKKGEYHAALYFSIKTVMMKLGVHFSNFIIFALLPIGQGTTNIGIRSTALVAMGVAIIGLMVFSFYNEQNLELKKINNE